MANDPTVQWHLANPFGIQISEQEDGWNSGHLNDVLYLANGTILVAGETGGIWMLNENLSTLPLSDSWANPDMNCLAQGPDDVHHVFAGGKNGSIRETDLAEAVPLLAWKEISNPLPPDAGDVKRLLMLPRLRRIIAICTKGIFWATIPPTNPRQGCLMVFSKSPPRPLYNWNFARTDGYPKTQGYWDGAIGSTAKNQNRTTLEDRNNISIVAGSFISGGIFTGQWNAANVLVMSPAKFNNPDGSDATNLFKLMGTFSVASCEGSPNVLYSACSFPAKTGKLFRVLRSSDAGSTWTICKGFVQNLEDDLANVAGDQGRDWNNCITVSPNLANLVALGWGSVFISADSGETWNNAHDDNHLHADVHAVRFLPEGSTWAKDLYVCSDGGLAKIDMDIFLNGKPGYARSNYNHFLPTLQCYSTLVRQFWGTMSPSPFHEDLIATGSQDNSNIFCIASDTTPTPWTKMEGGDGGWTAFLDRGQLLHNVMGEPVSVSVITDAAKHVFTTAAIPINQAPDGTLELKGPVAERGVVPLFLTELHLPVVAFASPNNNQVFGLFQEDQLGQSYHWGLLGSIPAGQVITALGSYTGSTIHIGTYGKMFVMDTKTGTSHEVPIAITKADPDSTLTIGGITRIVFFNEKEVFAILNGLTETIDMSAHVLGGVSKTTTTYHIIRLDGAKWVLTPGNGLPSEPMYGLEAVQLSNSRFAHTLFVSTNDAVYASRENAETWGRAAQNLPVNPHCGDLRFMSFTFSEAAYLYLGTFGRSVWRAKLR